MEYIILEQVLQMRHMSTSAAWKRVNLWFHWKPIYLIVAYFIKLCLVVNKWESEWSFYTKLPITEISKTITGSSAQEMNWQNRMVTGEDCQVSPLSVSQEIIKVR